MTRPKRFAGLAITAAMVMLVSTPGAAASQTCGGTAPFVRSCGFSGVLDAQDILTMHGGPLYIGRITVTITTDSGQEVDHCDFVIPLQNAVCEGARTGLLLPGQPFTLTARTGVVFAGAPALTVGRWSVTFESV